MENIFYFEILFRGYVFIIPLAVIDNHMYRAPDSESWLIIVDFLADIIILLLSWTLLEL